MTNRPSAILFDLDDTIISYRPRDLMLAEIAEEFSDALAPHAPVAVANAIEAEFKTFWGDPARYRNWRMRLRDARRDLVVECFTKLPNSPAMLSTDLAHRIADRFHHRRESEMFFFPGACETIDALNLHGVKLALVTNGASETQRMKIDQFDLARRFHHIQVEEEAGFGKPDERAYRRAMHVLEVGPQETWMVGDHLEFDVGAPQRLGILGIWHDHLGQGLPPHASVRPDRVIRRLDELLPIG